jgi:hypothetical protein
VKKLRRRGYTVKDKTGERFVYNLTEDDRRLFEMMCLDFEGTPEQFFQWAHTFTGDILARDPGRPPEQKKKTYPLRDAYIAAATQKPGLGVRTFLIRNCKLNPGTPEYEKKRSQLRRELEAGQKFE